MSTQREMPKYQCHKQVWAFKIKDILTSAEQGNRDITIVPAEDGYSPFVVSAEYVDKHKPQIGGYYVLYVGGYTSYSPAKEFLSGYSLIR